jgi:transposase
MSVRRIDMDRLQELVRLHRMKTGAREVARLLGMSPNTERVYRLALATQDLLGGPVEAIPELDVLKAAVQAALPSKPVPQSTSSLERWSAHVRLLAAKGLGPRAIYDRLRLEHADFDGTYWAMKRMVRQIGRERGVRAEDVAIPVETAAGDVAQVDFGEVGRVYDPLTGGLRRAWVFVLVLGHSRRMVTRLVFDQKVETWLRLHVEAFVELGGVPATVVPDNLKAAVVRAAFGTEGATALNRSYRELARHYGFKVDPAPVRQPKKKGKVESGVRYVKHNGLAGLDGRDVDEVRAHLARWTDEVANQRIHSTTQRRPAEVFEAEERTALRPLPSAAYEPVVWHEAGVHRDAHVAFAGRLYSVPWKLIGGRVWLRASAHTVDVYASDERVASHERRGRSPRATREEHLPPERAPLRHRSQAFWEARADRLDPEVGAYVREIFASDDVLSLLRVVQAIVTHLEGFPRERAVAACRRASHFGNFTYGGLKTILRQGLDLSPLPTTGAPSAPPPAATPRYARAITELLHLTKEESDELH